jgi:hypothetical protein
LRVAVRLRPRRARSTPSPATSTRTYAGNVTRVPGKVETSSSSRSPTYCAGTEALPRPRTRDARSRLAASVGRLSSRLPCANVAPSNPESADAVRVWA